jgi:chemotaxis methyl-accepting protein methylase
VNSSVGELAALVHRRTGIVMSGSQETALLGALRRAAPGLGPAEFLLRSGTESELIDDLVDEVTVKETTFLRDRAQLDAIDWHGLLARAVRAGSPSIRVWSAACATGEEAYSLALLAAVALGVDDPPIDILGTDISRAAITDAERGRYRERALRHVDGRLRAHYFTEDGGAHTVSSALRRHVRFRLHNLVSDPIPPHGELAFDLIVCRNVLIYFDLPTIDRVRVGLSHALRAGGSLVIGAADALGGSAPSGRPIAAPSLEAALPIATRKRRPLGRRAIASRDDLLRSALAAADAGRCDEAREHTASLLRRTQLDADAYFVNGVVDLEQGMPTAAVASLRRALFIDPGFGLAAFALAFTYDALGESDAARRAYEQALRTVDPADDRQGALLERIDLHSLIEACRLRLDATVALRGAST